MNALATKLALDITTSHPREGWAKFLFGVIGQTVYLIPDEKWEEIKENASVPCDTLGCDCHIMHLKVLAGLEELRNDAKKTYETGLDRMLTRPKKS